MAAPLVFNPYTGWVDIPDAQNIPNGARLIAAADLLRYENFLTAVRDRINAHELSIVDLTPAVATLISDLNAAEAVNTTQAGLISTLQADLDTAEANIAALTRGTVVASTNQTLAKANRFYTHTGGAVTYTLPPLAANVGVDFMIKNRGTGTVTVRGTETNKMYGTAVSDTFGVLAGSGLIFHNDGTYWNRIGG